MDIGQLLGVGLGVLCVSFGLLALLKECKGYVRSALQQKGIFDSKRRSRRRIVCSAVLAGTGAALLLGLSFPAWLSTPMHLLVFCMVLAAGCVLIGILVVLDVLETSRTLSTQYDKMVDETTQALEEIARISRARSRQRPTDN